MIPTTSRIVHYRLTRANAEAINRRRQHAHKHMENHRVAANGVQVHVGNHHSAGDVVPLLIVRVWDNEYVGDVRIACDTAPDEDPHYFAPKSQYGINGQAFLDGNDTLWITSAPQGEHNGCWDWPPRV